MENQIGYYSPESLKESVYHKVQDANSEKLPREFYQNTVEHPMVRNTYVDEVSIDGLPVKKFCMINDGSGMTIEALNNMKNLYDSGKNAGKSDEEKKNNNTGARIIALAANSLGLCYVSKSKDGINGCMLWLSDSKGAIHRLLSPEFDPHNLLSRDFGKEFDIEGEWTAVITLGHAPDQNTYLEPERGLLLDDCVKRILENRYFLQPMNVDGLDVVNLYIKGEKVVFVKDQMEKIIDKTWTFNTEMAEVTFTFIKDGYGYHPITGIIVDNEIFDTRWANGAIHKFIGDNSQFMRSVNSIKLKNLLSIMIKPFSNLEIKPNHDRTYLIKFDDNKSKNNLTCNAFSQDIKEYMPEDLRNYLSSFNEELISDPSKEIINELLENLHQDQLDDTEFELDEDGDSDETPKIHDKDEYLKELKETFVYQTYDLEEKSKECLTTPEYLREEILTFIKNGRKFAKTLIQDADYNVFEANELKEDSKSYHIEVFEDIFAELVETDVKYEYYKAFGKLIKQYLSLLKKDVVEPVEKETVEKDAKEPKEKHSKIKLSVLDTQFFNNEEWESAFNGIKRNKYAYGYYNDDIVSINYDHRVFDEVKDYVKDLCYKGNIPYEESISKTIIRNTLGLLASFFKNYNHIAKVEELICDNPEDIDYAINRVAQMTAEHLLTAQIQIKKYLKLQADSMFKAS